MGKGDRKTRRGKITKGTFGVSRRKKPQKVASENGVPAKKAKPAPAAKSVRGGGAKPAEKTAEPVAAAEAKAVDKKELAKAESKPEQEKPKATGKSKATAKPDDKNKEAGKKNKE